jgi:hypothetical protein
MVNSWAGAHDKQKATTKIISIGLPQRGSGGRNNGKNPVNGYEKTTGQKMGETTKYTKHTKKVGGGNYGHG